VVGERRPRLASLLRLPATPAARRPAAAAGVLRQRLNRSAAVRLTAARAARTAV